LEKKNLGYGEGLNRPKFTTINTAQQKMYMESYNTEHISSQHISHNQIINKENVIKNEEEEEDSDLDVFVIFIILIIYL
jgi:hypothetical protein